MKILQQIKRAGRRLQRPALVLMYHSIATSPSDPWELAVGAGNFEQQLQVLKQTKMVVPMSCLVEQLYKRKSHKSGIVLTFDDGYADNYLTAKPLLEKYELPATFFICTKHIGTQQEFWWDELSQMLLHTQQLPRKIAIDVHGLPLSFALNEESSLTEAVEQKHKRWSYTQAPPTRRTQLYLKLWELLSPLTYQQQQDILEALRQWAGISVQPRSDYLSMSREQLLELAHTDLFNIGAHTVSHPALANHPQEVQRQEISQSKQYLESLTGMDINLFAYPSGIFNETSIHVLKQEGFRAAFTTYQRRVKSKDDPYQIGRFQVNNWSGKVFKQILSDWF